MAGFLKDNAKLDAVFSSSMFLADKLPAGQY